MIYDWLYNLTGSEIIAAGVQSLLPLFVFILPFALIAVLLERKVSAHMQDRLGPMRVGYHGILQTIADILKLVQKEDIVAADNDKKFFNLSPLIVFAGSYAAFAAIPFSGAFMGSNIDLGIIYIIAVTGLVVAGILMGGWASNNKYSLLVSTFRLMFLALIPVILYFFTELSIWFLFFPLIFSEGIDRIEFFSEGFIKSPTRSMYDLLLKQIFANEKSK